MAFIAFSFGQSGHSTLFFCLVRQLKYILKEKNNALWRVDYFGFVRLDKFNGLFQLADKKRQETKKTYCFDEQKINSTGINDDSITTERPAANRVDCPAGS